ncbi:hypothetical protein [Thiogranum longum]
MNVSTNPVTQEKASEIPVIQRIIAVLWPSFIMSGIATGLFFTAFDPLELMAISGQADISRMGAYSIGFFLFWLLTSSTCALTCYFQKPCDTIKGHR